MPTKYLQLPNCATPKAYNKLAKEYRQQKSLKTAQKHNKLTSG